MIKHHPKFELIQAFVTGELPASLSAGIAIHSEMCSKCHHQITQLTEQLAECSFEEATFQPTNNASTELLSLLNTSNIEAMSIDNMIAEITVSDEIDAAIRPVNKTVIFNKKPCSLPTALTNMTLDKAVNIGKLSRSRIQLNENEIHTSLLTMRPGGGIPEHTHKGFELTLLLEGSFSDEKGEYVKGDFIMCDASHQHHPVSEQGCLCYTVTNDALHFTQGINKLLNPIGAFIY